MVALVSEEDFEQLNQFKWYASHESRGTKYYAIRRVYTKDENGRKKGTKIRMHRVVMGLGTGFEDPRVVDHLDRECELGHIHTGDPLDNRRCGLEIITQEENMKRSKGWKKKIEEPWL